MVLLKCNITYMSTLHTCSHVVCVQAEQLISHNVVSSTCDMLLHMQMSFVKLYYISADKFTWNLLSLVLKYSLIT